MRHVIIYGLRRSGTTILWETLRQSPLLTCYDEPFHPRLALGADWNHKGTWDEFKRLPTMEPHAIEPIEELDEVSTEQEKLWLERLCKSGQTCAIDIVRGWNRAPAIHSKCGDVLAIHLVRDPASWVAAHLLPSGANTFRRRVASIYRRASFFTRLGFYDNYQYQTIIDEALAKKHPVFNYVSLSHDLLARSPAYIKLLAFWWGANCTLAGRLFEANGPNITLTLGELTDAADAQIKRISDAANWPDFSVSSTAIKTTRAAYGKDAKHWKSAASKLGIPYSIFSKDGSTSVALSEAFRMSEKV